MSLERVTHIEGYVGHQETDLADDTHPLTGKNWFTVEAVEIPFLTNDPISNPKGEIIRENRVFFNWERELGNLCGKQRVRDSIKFDEASGKWKVLRLLPDKQSWIRRYPEAWNSFATNTALKVVGTPLAELFPNDPARALMYAKRYDIETIEQLAAVTSADADSMGMGGSDDYKKAKAFLERSRESVRANQGAAQIEALGRENDTLKNQIADLSAKLTELLSAQIEAGEVKKSKKSKTVEEA